MLHEPTNVINSYLHVARYHLASVATDPGTEGVQAAMLLSMHMGKQQCHSTLPTHAPQHSALVLVSPPLLCI